MDLSEWNDVLSVNLNGVMYVTSAVLPQMLERKFGRIINISSFVAQAGNFGQTNYAAAKAGIIGLTLSCANGLGRYGVTANAILPTGATRMIDSIPRAVQAVAHTGKMPSELAKGTERDPDNVAPLIAFLASNAAQEINGHIFGSFGYNVALMAQPKIIKTLRADHRWTVEELCTVIPQALGSDLEEQKNRSDFGKEIEAIPPGDWVDVGNGLSFWGTKIEPYHELTWV